MKDNQLIAKTKRLKFKDKYKDYKINLFGYDTVQQRNHAIKKIYNTRLILSQLENIVYNIPEFNSTIYNEIEPTIRLLQTQIQTMIGVLNKK